MVTAHGLIDAYLTRLRERASAEDDIDRFFLFLEPDLADMEDELSNSDQSREFYDRLLEQFRAWRAEMGEERWREVIARNESLNGANQNGLLDEV